MSEALRPFDFVATDFPVETAGDFPMGKCSGRLSRISKISPIGLQNPAPQA
jgi:hypothetical protein